jgi:hypothetical protein
MPILGLVRCECCSPEQAPASPHSLHCLNLSGFIMDRGGRNSTGGGTYIEEFLDAIANVPNEVKRNLELMRALDKSAREMGHDLNDTEKKFLQSAKKKLKEKGDEPGAIPKQIADDPAALAEIDLKRAKCYQMADEKIAIADQTAEMVEVHMTRLRNDLIAFEEKLKASGGYNTVGARPGDEVAIRLDPSEDLWVLARVLDYDAETGIYGVLDEDDNSKTYELSEINVIHLESTHSRLSKQDEVLAVYPDTTSFYKATVMQPPRRSGGQGFAMVQFAVSEKLLFKFCLSFLPVCLEEWHSRLSFSHPQDDADEYGNTPQRQVPALHVVKLPLS